MSAERVIGWSAAAFVALAGLGLDLGARGGVRLDSAAHAIVGAPLTPVSVAGVARRTTRRTVVVASSASASAAASQQQAAAAQQQAAASQQQAAAAQQQAAAAQQQVAASKLPVGTTVSALPSGCNTVNMSGADYFDCGGTYYRAAFQSNNIVYVVSQP
jgi:hypothetical protein